MVAGHESQVNGHRMGVPMSKVYVGTASWTDPTLTETTAFYPRTDMTPEERLRFYAERFNTVEVDSTYYALPAERMVAVQVERTPADFDLNYKAFGMLTRHNVDPRRFPKAIKALIPPDVLERTSLPFQMVTKDVLDLAFKMFASALRPAFNAGKLGVILLQFSPSFKFGPESFDYIAMCKEKLFDYRVAVEFRHASWVTDEHAGETFGFLSANGLAYVSVDEPQFESHTTLPPIMTSTSPTAYIRLHGRNKDAWFKRGITTAERFKYLYSEEELGDLETQIEPVIAQTERTYVVFNNCFASYGVTNAEQMKQIMQERMPDAI